MTRRIEFTVANEIAEKYDEARGHEPLASWIKRALESALTDARGTPAVRPPQSAPIRAPGNPAAEKAKREAPPDRRVKAKSAPMAMARQERLNKAKAGKAGKR